MADDEKPVALSDDDLDRVVGGNGPPISRTDATSLQGMSLDTIMMMVNADRANMLDGQVRAQASQIKAGNDLLIAANNAYAQTADLARQFGRDAKSDDRISIGDWTAKGSIGQFLTSNGIAGAPGDAKTISKAEVETLQGNMKTFIDNLTATSQSQMTQLQSVMNRFNQTTEGLANWLSKDAQSKNTIVGNLR